MRLDREYYNLCGKEIVARLRSLCSVVLTEHALVGERRNWRENDPRFEFVEFRQKNFFRRKFSVHPEIPPRIGKLEIGTRTVVKIINFKNDCNHLIRSSGRVVDTRP